MPREKARPPRVPPARRVRSARAEVAASWVGFLEAAPDAVVIVNAAGEIALVNTRAEQLFGYPHAELLGQPVELLLPARLRSGHPERRQAYFAAPHPRTIGSALEMYGLRKDGAEFPIEVSLNPLPTEAGLLVSSAIRDVSERKRAEELRERLAAIVDCSDDAIIGATLQGVIHSWNRGAERIFGYSPAEALGQPLAMLRPLGAVDEEPAILARLGCGERAEPFETVRQRKDARLIDVGVTLSGIRDARGELIGVSTVARDISRRKCTEAALSRARTAVEVASREFEAFSYSVAHDLRAPLRAIDGFSHALMERHGASLDDDGRMCLARVRSAAHHMAQLIDDLLMLARVTQTDLRRESVDLSALAHSALDRLREAEPQRAVEVRISERLTAQGDGRLLAIALQNLLGNAWKFTRQQPAPRIEFTRSTDGSEPAFCVRDNGAGFDMAFATKLFGVFQRLHSVSEFEGTGIGLATVQRIVRRHGGRIWAQAEVGRGAAFYFTLEEGPQTA